MSIWNANGQRFRDSLMDGGGSSGSGGGGGGGGTSAPAQDYSGLLNASSFQSPDQFLGLLSNYFPNLQGYINQTFQGGTGPSGQVGGPMQPGMDFDQMRGAIYSMPTTAPPVSTASSQFKSNYGSLTKDLYGKSSSSSGKSSLSDLFNWGGR